ncbi:MAG: response regulator transcription factor [Candidatus Omnitrophica bacterium]|nr:response regulator transcription factor [Candidatus Omnitrophota bacterium]
MPIKITLVEDDPRFRNNLASLINRVPGFICLSQYPDARQALEHIPRDKPDIVLMDVNLPGMDGIECVRQLRILSPAVNVVMLTVYEESDRIFRALEAGAVGYLLKPTPSAEILEALEEVQRGGSPMSSHIARMVVQSFQRPAAGSTAESQLSSREHEVLELLAKGFYNKEIADQLSIGIGSVNTYIRRIYKKLQVRCRTEAVAKFLG